MAGTRRIGPDSHGWATRRPAPCQSEDDVAPPPARRARRSPSRSPSPRARRPTAARRTRAARCAPTASPEAPPYDTPQGHIRVHYVADPADSASPALTSTRVAGVPDWVVSAGELAEDGMGARDRARLPGAAARQRRRRRARGRRPLRPLRLRPRGAGPRRARGDRRRSARLGLQLRRDRRRLRAERGRAAHELGPRAAAREHRARAVPRDPDRREPRAPPGVARRGDGGVDGGPRSRPRTSTARSTGSRSAAPAPSSRTGARAACTSTAPGG